MAYISSKNINEAITLYNDAMTRIQDSNDNPDSAQIIQSITNNVAELENIKSIISNINYDLSQLAKKE